jgi:predicted dehydrogenase
VVVKERGVPHRVLVIGVGSIGERHLRCFRATGRADVALVEVRDVVRRAVAERYGVEHAFADLNPAWAYRPDVAVIATPAPLHVALATRLAEGGIHVLVEKPLAVSLDGVDRLLDAVRGRGVTAAVAYVYRCHPLLAAMRQAVCSGRIGQPVELVAVAGQHFPTYRPAYREIYYADRTTGGGAIQDALTHLLNAGEWLLGAIDRLVADAAHQVLEGVSVEDTVHLLARHRSVLASYSLNQHQAPNEITITVVGTRATARCEFHRHRWRLLDRPEQPWQDETIAPLERDALFIRQANAFLDAVENRGPVPCSLEEGTQTLRVNLAALQSLDRGAWQTVEGSGIGVQGSGLEDRRLFGTPEP